MQRSMANQRKHTQIKVVKMYESVMQDEEVKLVMYRKGASYGVATIRHNTVLAKNYQEDEQQNLSTFIGNEASIIDWIDINEATVRYNSLLMDLIGKTKRTAVLGAQNLRVVA